MFIYSFTLQVFYFIYLFIFFFCLYVDVFVCIQDSQGDQPRMTDGTVKKKKSINQSINLSTCLPIYGNLLSLFKTSDIIMVKVTSFYYKYDFKESRIFSKNQK